MTNSFKDVLENILRDQEPEERDRIIEKIEKEEKPESISTEDWALLLELYRKEGKRISPKEGARRYTTK